MEALNLDEPSDEELDMLDLAYGLEDRRGHWGVPKTAIP